MSTSFLEQLQKARANRDLSVFDGTSIEDFSDEDIKLILHIAEIFHAAGTHQFNFLEHTSIVNAFFENSTRTRLSFELAGKHLGADTAHISGGESSAKKGESLLDTIQTLSALGTKIIVLRVSESGVPHFLKKYSPAAIVNAGDGWNEHPSQGLLDLKTILDHHKTLKGKIVTIVGDVLHSRVFGSLVRILKRFGAEIRVTCPQTFLPSGIEQFGVEVSLNPEEALRGAHVVYTLRVQEERGAAGDIPNLREYFQTFGITPERFALADKNAILMHPGPVIRGTDVSPALMHHERCHILKQVTNGLAVRKALLWLLGARNDGKVKPFLRA